MDRGFDTVPMNSMIVQYMVGMSTSYSVCVSESPLIQITYEESWRFFRGDNMFLFSQ